MFYEWNLHFGTSRNLTFHEWNLDFGTSRNLTFHEWNLHFGTSRNLTFHEWNLHFGTSRNLTFHEWNLHFGTSRNLTFHEWNLHFGTSRNLNGTFTSEPLGTGSIPLEPLGTWCKVSGGCPKPPRSFIGRTPSLSGCWGKTTNLPFQISGRFSMAKIKKPLKFANQGSSTKLFQRKHNKLIMSKHGSQTHSTTRFYKKIIKNQLEKQNILQNRKKNQQNIFEQTKEKTHGSLYPRLILKKQQKKKTLPFRCFSSEGSRLVRFLPGSRGAPSPNSSPAGAFWVNGFSSGLVFFWFSFGVLLDVFSGGVYVVLLWLRWFLRW